MDVTELTSNDHKVIVECYGLATLRNPTLANNLNCFSGDAERDNSVTGGFILL